MYELHLTYPTRLRFPLKKLTGAQAIIHKLYLRLSTHTNTWPMDAELGLPLLDIPMLPPNMIKALIQEQVRLTSDAITIQDISVTKVSGIINVHISISINLGSETTNAQITWLPDNSYQPGVWLTFNKTKPIIGV